MSEVAAISVYNATGLVNHHVDLSIPGDLILGMWLNLGSVVIADYQIIICKGAGALTRVNYMVYVANGSVNFFQSGLTTPIPGAPTDGWFHLAVARIGNSIKGYINGVETTGTYGHPSPVENTDSLYLFTDSSGHSFRGRVCRIQLWKDTVKSAEQIAEMMTTVDTEAPGLVAYWTCEGDPSIQTLMDSGGENHHANLSGIYGFTSSLAP